MTLFADHFPQVTTTLAARLENLWPARRKFLFLLLASLAAWSLILSAAYAVTRFF